PTDVGVQVDADAGRGGNRQRAVRVEDEGRLGDVLRVVAGTCRDVSRERESFQRGQGDVVSAPDIGLQHAAAPDGRSTGEAEIVNCAALRMAPNTASLDVDDPAAAEVEGMASVVRRVDALVETDRRAK